MTKTKQPLLDKYRDLLIEMLTNIITSFPNSTVTKDVPIISPENSFLETVTDLLQTKKLRIKFRTEDLQDITNVFYKVKENTLTSSLNIPIYQDVQLSFSVTRIINSSKIKPLSENINTLLLDDISNRNIIAYLADVMSFIDSNKGTTLLNDKLKEKLSNMYKEPIEIGIFFK